MALDLSLRIPAATELTGPALTALLDLGLDLAATLPARTSAPARTGKKISWSAAKGDAETKLYKATHEKEPWIARVTELSDVGYDALRRGLMVEKTATEKEALLGAGDVVEVVADGKGDDGVETQGNSAPPAVGVLRG